MAGSEAVTSESSRSDSRAQLGVANVGDVDHGAEHAERRALQVAAQARPEDAVTGFARRAFEDQLDPLALALGDREPVELVHAQAVFGPPGVDGRARAPKHRSALQARRLLVGAIEREIVVFEIPGAERIRDHLHHRVLQLHLAREHLLGAAAAAHLALQQHVSAQRDEQQHGGNDQERQQPQRVHAPAAGARGGGGGPAVADLLLLDGRHRPERAIDEPRERREVATHSEDR
ncbi:hypothetical protein C7402_101607 [Paraburkholderia unamae]|uniref:Uncharacterized protein n=1 Tax=Paraburkholderia unamae TaxID=219649 RepID=A0ABX5KWD2_9BURK|nr:hypothetical protein C7402_101607 [Paraburkholderia unamae]